MSSTFETRDKLFAAFSLLVACVLSCTIGLFSRVAFAADSLVPEEVIMGGVKIEKTLPIGLAQGKAKVAGTQFSVYEATGLPVTVKGDEYFALDDSAHLHNPVAVLTIGEDGKATTDAKVLPYGTYEIRETAVPDGVKLDTNYKQQFQIRTDGKIVDIDTSNNKLALENPVYRGGISLSKVDAETGVPQGGSSLAGAEFTVYNISGAPVEFHPTSGSAYFKSGYNSVKEGADKAIPSASSQDSVADANIVTVLVTDDKGQIKTENNVFDYGTYLVRETKAPANYKIPKDTVYVVEIDEDGEIIEIGVEEPVNRGGIELTKMDRERAAGANEPQGNASLNAKYAIQYQGTAVVRIDGSDFVSNGTDWKTVYTLTANAETGHAITADNLLPAGHYRVIEIEPADGYLLDDNWSWEFDIKDDGVILKCPDSAANKNQVARAGFKLIKIDADTLANKPQGDGKFDGIKFQLVNRSKHSVIVRGKTYAPGAPIELGDMLVMKGGRIETPKDLLPTGTYEISEIEVPAVTGYLRNTTWSDTFEVTVSDNGEYAQVTTKDKWDWYELRANVIDEQN